MWDQSLGQEDTLGEGNGNPLQYSCLGNPWTEAPCRLQSMGLKRIQLDLDTKQQSAHIFQESLPVQSKSLFKLNLPMIEIALYYFII